MDRELVADVSGPKVLRRASRALWALGLLGLLGCAESLPAAPTALIVTAASREAISIGWTASATATVTRYTVERAPVGGDAFAQVREGLSSTELVYTDFTVDPHTAYTYRVRAGNADGASEPSNEDTAGPPPASLQVAAAVPADQGTVHRYGTHSSLALDGNHDPMIAYVGEYSGNSSNDTCKLYFLSWDRVNYQWKAPHLVDAALGPIDSNQPHRQVSLARDKSNGRLGISYTVGNNEIWLTMSEDGGATWAKARVDLDDANYDGETSNPSLALANGKTHLAYYHHCIKQFASLADCNSQNDSHAVVYLSRSSSSEAFAHELSPVLAQTQDAKPFNELALDGSGNPGIVYYLGAPDGSTAAEGYNVTLAYWRPGQAAVKVLDSENTQNDAPSLSLAYHGAAPRILAHLLRDEPSSADLWFSASADGVSWGSPVALPRDAGGQTGWNQSLALDSTGKAAASAYFRASSGLTQFGGPKLWRSSDLSVWAVSSPDVSVLPDFAGEYVDTTFAGNDRLSMAFFQGTTSEKLARGVVFWRE